MDFVTLTDDDEEEDSVLGFGGCHVLVPGLELPDHDLQDSKEHKHQVNAG